MPWRGLATHASQRCHTQETCSVVSSPGWRGDETLDPRRSLLSERYDGTLAERVVVVRSVMTIACQPRS